MTFENSSQSDQQWQPCPAGEVAGLVESLRQRQRRRRFQKISVTLCGLAVAGLIGLYAVPHPLLVEPGDGSISCSEVENLADEYVSGRLQGALRTRVEEHLGACDHCQQFITDLRDRRVALLPSDSTAQPLAVAEPQSLELIARTAR